MVIAGEASGDLHGAHLVKAMRALAPGLDFFGIGGNALRQAGVDVHVDNAQIAVVGFSEVFPKINLLLRALRQAKRDLKKIRPSLLILIDFPDFNLLVAGAAKKLGIPVMYYISPQIWAWRTYRVRKIKKLVDHMVVIFPFEVDFYEKWHVPVTFAGHPLLDSMSVGQTSDQLKQVNDDGILVGLLPGSRNEEISRLLPTMIEVAEILSGQVEKIRFAVPVASSVHKAVVEAMVGKGKARISIRYNRLRDVLDEATLVITASGTVTLEAAIAETPMIIVYKMSSLSYWLARLLVRVEHIGLANLVAEKPIVPELVQQAASADEIAKQALRMIRDQKGLERMRFELRRVAERLGDPGASKRAAKVALTLL
jgi:lipid-A-disaccharide synthase